MTIRLRTALVTSEADLHALAPDWWSLWRRCPVATPFQSPAWLLPWWRCFHPGALRVGAVWADETLVALATLYREEGPHGVRLLPLGISLSDYLDGLVDPDHADAAGAALSALWAGPDRDWDRVDWEELAPEACARAVPVPEGWRDESFPQGPCPVLRLPETIEALSGPVPPGKLRKLRMARHRCTRRAGRLETATAGSAPGLLAELFRLHGQRWEARGEAGVLADPLVRRFHDLAMPGLLAAGLLRLTALHLEDRVAGIYYGFAHRDRAYAYLGGFDPAFAFESPGTVLLGHAIEESVRDGAREFHWLRGREAYKYEWGAQDRMSHRRILSAPA